MSCNAFAIARFLVYFTALRSNLGQVIRTYSISHRSLPLFTPSSLALPRSFLSHSKLSLFALPCPGVPSLDPSRVSGQSDVSGCRQSAADKRFLVHSEFKITLPVIALLRKFSNNQIDLKKYCKTRDVVLVCPQDIPMWCFSEK